MTGSGEAGHASAAPPRRKLRALAVHGGYSNSNILKFQLAQLRKFLGKDVEWLMPSATVPLHPYADFPEGDMFPEVSEFEARIAQGKPLVSWYVLRKLSDGRVITDPDTWESGSADLIRFIDNEEPFDVAVGFSQGALMIARIALRFQREGRPIPWQLAVFFCPSDPTKEINPLEFIEPLTFPVLHITSPTDPHFMLSLRSYGQVCPAHLRTIITHEDGYAFPVTAPRATEIYTQIAEEVNKHCRRTTTPDTADFRLPTAPTTVNSDKVTHKGKVDTAPQHRPGEKDTVASISPEELAKLLVAGACLVVDTRRPETRGTRLFPGCDPKEDLSFAALQRGSKDLQRRLAHLERDGRQVVAVSRLGDLDREYCELLVGTCALPARRARWLAGGLRAWASWELDQPAVAEQVRLAMGLPARREAMVPLLEPSTLAELLRERRCIVADAREAAESRGKAFPGACKGLGFQLLQRRPDAARAGVERLRQDGRTVVVISATGGRCRQYCAMLVDQFGFREDLVYCLNGGLRSWAAWELENEEAAEVLRREYGLPPARCSLAAKPDDAAGRAERELSVEALGRYS